MIEEHVSFHFQQLSSWIDRVLMCYFTFPKVEKSGIFFWKPEIRPTLTAQKKYSKVCLGFNFFSHDEAACQFSFKSLLRTIIYLFDILFDFPGGRKIRKILPGFSRSPPEPLISLCCGQELCVQLRYTDTGRPRQRWKLMQFLWSSQHIAATYLSFGKYQI